MSVTSFFRRRVSLPKLFPEWNFVECIEPRLNGPDYFKLIAFPDLATVALDLASTWRNFQLSWCLLRSSQWLLFLQWLLVFNLQFVFHPFKVFQTSFLDHTLAFRLLIFFGDWGQFEPCPTYFVMKAADGQSSLENCDTVAALSFYLSIMSSSRRASLLVWAQLT